MVANQETNKVEVEADAAATEQHASDQEKKAAALGKAKNKDHVPDVFVARVNWNLEGA